jgi:hypothetical protein
MRTTTIRQALQHVVNNPELESDELVALPVHELVSRTLFEIANSAHPSKRGSLAKANVARKMIFDRLVGKRKAGSHPATKKEAAAVEFADLTGELDR